MNRFSKYITLALILIISQSLIFNNINFIGYINPLIYILFIIYYPLKNDRFFFILASFFLGISIDIFNDSSGLHSAACVSISYFRPFFLKLSFGMTYIHQVVKFNKIDFWTRLIYISSLTILHHLILFSLEIFNSEKIFWIFQKTIYTGLSTILICVIFSYLFKTNK